jgi:hypothetical protein
MMMFQVTDEQQQQHPNNNQTTTNIKTPASTSLRTHNCEQTINITTRKDNMKTYTEK